MRDNISTILAGSFPGIDTSIAQYVESVLENEKDDFDSRDDVFEAIGEILLDVSDGSRTESDILDICQQFWNLLVKDRPSNEKRENNRLANGEHKALPATVDLAASCASIESSINDFNSIWIGNKTVQSQVDQKKLGKAEAKLRLKADKREQNDLIASSSTATDISLSQPTASQMISRKDVKADEGSSRVKDIKIENFDIAFGDKVLLKNATITLSYGRRYGLVGRNGIGKSTLLQLISSRSLFIPRHISILHVEQEVTGDDKTALEAVLESDVKRNQLLEEEKSLQGKDESSERLQQVYAELSAIEADKAPARASEILAGLGFTPEMQRRATKEFSGGWRMRISLARALFSQPDLLLLDEPTNMLDMKAIIWLENHLVTKWTSTLLVVSHDRQFLNVVPTDTLYFANYEITPYKGNFDNFVKVRTERVKNQEREYEAQMDYRKHVQEFIDKFRYNAKRASLVQSKIKMLEKLPELKPLEKESTVSFRFEDPEPLSGSPILQLDEVYFRYSSSKSSEFLLENLSIGANLKSRICIVGDNGSGKTTLLKLLTGDLAPSKGFRNTHRALKVGYFTQHHVDQLVMNQSPLEFLASRFPGKPSEQYRSYLGKFGISGDLALQPLAALSGGQKSRVAFAAMSATNPNIVVLDEPTNHLDVETVEALGKSLNSFTGGVILVSHDEQLIKMVCKEMWYVKDKKVISLEGFDQYRLLIEQELQETLGATR